MVYKKYFRKNGKRFGPYYYESFREGNKVKKRYIGGEKEYHIWLNKNKKDGKKVEQFIVVSKNFFNIGILLFLLSLIALIFVIGWNFGSFTKIIPFTFTGFAVSENISGGVSDDALLYGNYENEAVVEQFDKEKVDLEIKEPPKFAGEVVSENKNKRMEFDSPEGKIRLYFDLLNYSEFVDEVSNLVEQDKAEVLREKQNQEKKAEISETQETTETPEIIEETNVTQETLAKQPVEVVEETPLQETRSEQPALVEEPVSEPVPETPITGGVVAVEKGKNILGNSIKYSIGFFIKVFEKIGITGRAVEDTNISEEAVVSEEINTNSETIAEETQTTTENNSNNLVNNINNNISSEGIVSEGSSVSQTEQTINSETSQTNPASETISATTTEEIQNKVEELNNDEIKTIEEQANIIANDFEVNVTTADENKYKWGYKVRLNSLDFMAKIDVTSDKNISILSDDSLQIGNQILSFNDLVKAGYTIRIEKPALEINISADETSSSETPAETITEETTATSENSSNNIINNNISEVNEQDINCYDNETQILTETGWKLFNELDKNVSVATLNQKTKELEYQKPIEYQEFNYNGNMYKIILEDNSRLLVSEEHKVYSNNDENNNLINKENATENVASKVMQILADYNNYNNSRYLNVSVYNNIAEVAPVASMVMRQSEKLGLSGRPGSIPGWSASALNFSLQQITDVYEDINENNKDIYFLDENNNPIKVKSITKVPYSGKIYDVDVKNDIVLVRRNSNGKLGRAVWSGNSNHSEQEIVIEQPVEQTGITGNIIKSFSKAFYSFAGLTGSLTGRVVDTTGFAIEKTEIENIEYENTITIYIERDFNEKTQSAQQTTETTSDNLDINNNINNSENIIGDGSGLESSSVGEGVSEQAETNLITGNVIAGEEITFASDNITTENSLPSDNSNNINNINNINSGESLVGVSESSSELNNLLNKINYEDIDGDGKISVGDIIELDPTLTYIYISKAEHLDLNRNYISDIYPEVKEQDGNWSEVINNNEFVRVSFEKNLTNKNDITFYGRGADNCSANLSGFIVINGESVPCEIYNKKKRIDEIQRLLEE